MVGAKGCPVGAPGGGAVASFKGSFLNTLRIYRILLSGALCSGPYAKYFKGAIAVAVAGALAYGIYAYVASDAQREPARSRAVRMKNPSLHSASLTGQNDEIATTSKPTKKGGKTKRKKRRSASSARLGRTSSSTSSTSTPGKPDEITDSAPATPKAEDAAPAAGAADATPAATADSTTTPTVHNVEPTQ
ncbi:hypothetical protein PRIPAC_75135 [Pristionchus pacificus]|uniref:Uncharacterized protein n=1 Tax=Pristionchus pacificus TaxID=54126 RepID=A0A2A6B5A3_PRIPA|nr:hypothetical protein PRIPAC_75135 [Pristionchus pacificus]|eukprot:PDM61033.1 hypothetical protein PRIPAC_54839 [Pristionchus pacificus]